MDVSFSETYITLPCSIVSLNLTLRQHPTYGTLEWVFYQTIGDYQYIWNLVVDSILDFKHLRGVIGELWNIWTHTSTGSRNCPINKTRTTVARVAPMCRTREVSISSNKITVPSHRIILTNHNTGPNSSTDLTAATCVEFERARIKLDVRILVTVKRFIVFTIKIERFHNPK